MGLRKTHYPTKQSDLSKWIYDKRNSDENPKYDLFNNNSKRLRKDKPKLAFGYGYDPNILRKGITKFIYSHDLGNGLKLYEFEPKLSYRIFNILAQILRYKCIGSEIKKGNTTIKNKYFITDKHPEKIVSELNDAIKELFKNFNPLHNPNE